MDVGYSLGKVAVPLWRMAFSLLAEHHTELCGTDVGIFVVALKQQAGLKSLRQHDVTCGKVGVWGFLVNNWKQGLVMQFPHILILSLV